jgi:hypothetical protein
MRLPIISHLVLKIVFACYLAVIAVIMTAVPQRQSPPTSEDKSALTSLTTEIEKLKTVLDRWNNAQMFFIILTAIAAAGLVVTGRGLISGGRKLATAQEHLSQLKDQIAEADSRAKNLEIAHAQNSAAQANVRAKQLEVTAEELKKENLEIQRKLALRFLTLSEQQSLVAELNQYGGHAIQITTLGDAEASSYGGDFIVVFRNAKWAVQHNTIGVLSPPLYGIICKVSAHPDAAVNAILDAFQRLNLRITTVRVPTPQESFIDLIVGLKPLT